MEHVSQSATAESAMTEIALALAMGFFAIMVLTMVSMGAGHQEKAQEQAKSVTAASLLPNATDTPTAAATEVAPDDQIVIFFRDAFYDTDLTPVDLGGLVPDSRVILAVPPDLPLSRAMELRGRFDRENLVVSTLDARWMERLNNLQQEDAQ